MIASACRSFIVFVLVLLGLTAGLPAREACAEPLEPPAAGPSPHRSTDPPPAVSLEVLIAEALARAPVIAAAAARREAARERVLPASALPDPMASAGWTEADFPRWSLGREPMSTVSIGISQALPYPGKRQARRQVADAETTMVGTELAAVRAAIVAEVRRLYARLYAIDRERRSLDAAAELLDLLAATAASRYAVGQSDQVAVIRAQLEVSQLGERIDDLAGDRQTVVADLNRVLNRPGDAPLGEVLDLPPVAAPPQDAEQRAVDHSPMIASRRTAIDLSERRVSLATLDLKPDFVLGSELGIRGGLPPVFSISVGVQWPWRKNERQRPLIRAAEQEVAAARADYDAQRAVVRSEVARFGAEWQRADQQVRRYEQAILPQTSAALDAARAAYLAGRGDFSSVVENFRLWLEARVAVGRREADRFTAWAGLQSMVTPDGVGPSGEEHER